MSRETRQRKSSRRRQRDFCEKRAAKTYLAPGQSSTEKQTRILRLISYNISYEPLEKHDPAEEKMIAELGEERLQDLYDRLHDHPQSLVSELERLVDRYPNVSFLYNWLTMAYQAANDKVKRDALIRLNFQRNPDYLFALVSMCQLLLGDGDPDGVTRILGKRFNLKIMYPQRDTFHITEVLALEHLLVKYFVRLENIDQAKIHLGIMKKLEPDHSTTKDASRAIDLASIGLSGFFRRWAK